MNNPENENPEITEGKDKDKEFDGFVIRIRGLPWSASKDDIVKFFDESAIKDGAQGIHLTMSREGRPSGEAYIEFENEEDVTKAMGKDNEHLGSRYIEVFRSSDTEMEWALRKCGLDGEEAFGDACVRLRGLPFGCSKEEIAQFFTGLEIVRNGITLPIDHQGRSTGEAYVQFASQDIAEKAMGKHKEKIGHRYIEIFKSSLQEIRSATGMGPMRMRGSMGGNRMNPYDRMDRPSMYGGGGGGGGFGRGRGGFNNKSRFGDYGDDYSMYDRFSGPGRRGGGMGGGDRFFGGRGGGGRDTPSTGHEVHMRGLPYRAVERDIYEFFAPLNPANIVITTGPGGRPSGEADVEFSSHEEAVKAMKRDKEKIQHRYIELFLHSEPQPFRRGGGGGGGGGGFNDMGGFPSEERGFGGGGGGFGRGGGSARGFEDRSFGGSPGMNRGFGAGGDRGFGGGDRSFSSDTTGDGYGFSGADRSGFGSGGDRSFNQGSGGGNTERFGGMGQGRGMPAGRSFGGNMSSGGGDYRNGNGQSGGGGMSGGGGYRADNFGQDGKDESEFYGSGKLFGGESNFQQSQGMMGGSNYTSF